MWEMNSSVTFDSATSVTSSWCLAMRPSSRSNGPSKTSRCTSNAAGPPAPGSSMDVMSSATGHEPHERAGDVVQDRRQQRLRPAERQQHQQQDRDQADVLVDEVVLRLLPASGAGRQPEQQPPAVKRRERDQTQ